MTDKLTVLIKVVNQSVSDLKIDCDGSWTVRDLKEKINLIHPVAPQVVEQRLIYSGQLLQDSFSLKTVFLHPSENNVYTVHLVYSNPKPSVSETKQSSQDVSNKMPVTTSAHSSSSEAFTDGLRRRYVGQAETSNSTEHPFSDPSSMHPYISQLSPLQAMADPIQQMAAVQQMYAQYMASYMQYMQSGDLGTFMNPQEIVQVPTSMPPLSAGPFMPHADPTLDHRPQEQQQGQPNANDDQEERQNIPDQRLNAQVAVGAVDEDEEEAFARDWLDYVYIAIRMVLMLWIVYFYSTFKRLLLVVGSCVLIYLYQLGWFRSFWLAIREPQNVENPPPRAAAAEEEEDDAAAAVMQQQGLGERATPMEEPPTEPQPSLAPPSDSGDSGGGEDVPQEGGSGDASAGEEGEENNRDSRSSSTGPETDEELRNRHSFISLIWTFVSTFFTSLIPEQDQGQVV